MLSAVDHDLKKDVCFQALKFLFCDAKPLGGKAARVGKNKWFFGFDLVCDCVLNRCFCGGSLRDISIIMKQWRPQKIRPVTA